MSRFTVTGRRTGATLGCYGAVMDRAELMDRLTNAEWDVSQGARRLAGQQRAIRQLRTCMRDITGAEALLIDLERAQTLSVRVRDRLRSLIEHLN